VIAPAYGAFRSAANWRLTFELRQGAICDLMSDAPVKIGITPTYPGEFVRAEILGELGLSVSTAAEILGVRRATLPDLLHGKAALSPEMALMGGEGIWRGHGNAAADAGMVRHDRNAPARRRYRRETVPASGSRAGLIGSNTTSLVGANARRLRFDEFGQRVRVLGDRGEEEFVLRTRRAAQSQSIEPENGYCEVCCTLPDLLRC
jgi:hypothetical protein